MADPADRSGAPAKARSCPICGKPVDPAWRPFCSKRCADVDLGRWLSDRYRIAGSGDDEPDDGSGEAPGDFAGESGDGSGTGKA